jgi:hypothetical protein
MSATIAARWSQLEREDAACLVCESGGSLADAGLELTNGARVRLCGDYVAAAVVALRLESKSAVALGEAHKRELTAVQTLLDQAEAQRRQAREERDSLLAECERLRQREERRKDALQRIVSAAGELA